ncbi:proline-rich protein 36-like [Helianthus annuus]|uniref:proline-rich protein 36-like n=1 Tax=Helianthus annuus TaxID=4232 RepID=UPI000B900348|nr:proline-rich protein 36-like [Helianthus annuus]
MAPEPIVAPDPALEHDPVHDDASAIAPLVDDIPVADLPVVAPPVVDDPVVDTLIPDPVPALIDRAPFAAHIDPRYADTHNGWIDDDDDYPPFVRPVTPLVAPVSAPTDIPLFPLHTTDTHRTDLPIMFLQDIPPPRPGEGSSRQLPVSAPPMMSSPFPLTSQFPHIAPPIAPSFTPSSEPFLWTTPSIMPLSDPYHPYHVGYSMEDILTSLMIQQEALTRRIQELERAPRPPCNCQTPFAAPHAPRPLSPDSDVCFLTSEQ